MRDEDVMRAIEDSPWERARREATLEGTFLAAVVPVPCGWCGMFASTPGTNRCEHCVGKGVGR
jgi:hypothetical protein